jgi:hypothetical protein
MASVASAREFRRASRDGSESAEAVGREKFGALQYGGPCSAAAQPPRAAFRGAKTTEQD